MNQVDPARLANLNKNIQELRRREDKERCEESLSEFVKGAWPYIDTAEYKQCWAIDSLCDHLEAVTLGHIPRLLTNFPPRCSKTTVASICWVAWTWARSTKTYLSGPQVRFLCGSYNHDLALDNSNKTRRLIQSSWYQERWPILLRADQNTKCLIRGTPILMFDGTVRNIEDVKDGEKVLSYDLKSNRLVEDTVAHVWCNGVKSARKIKLSDGASVTATKNHRFYGWDDWSYVGDMKVGDTVSVIEKTPTQHGYLNLDDAFLLALWLAEGGKVDSSFSFSNIDQLIIDRASRIAKERGWSIKKHGDYTYHITMGKNISVGSPMRLLKDHLGSVDGYRGRTRLASQATDKIRIPDSIMSANDEAVLEFISTYIACDGCVVNKQNHGLSITTISERMARDFTILLKRFGVQSSLQETETSYVYNGVKKRGANAWIVKIFSRKEVEKLSRLYLFGKDEKFRSLLKWCSGKKRHTGSRCATIPPHNLCDNRWSTKSVSVSRAEDCGDDVLVSKITGGLSWRKINSIEDVGDVETWHLQTENTSLFFAEGVLSHNTKFDNTSGGSRISTSVKGSLLGLGGDIINIDDPHNTEDVESEADRATVTNWWKEISSTRLNDPKKSAIVVTMQRLHQSDVSGQILDSDENWVHLMLPMRHDESRHCVTVVLPQFNDPKPWEDPRTVDGELLWEERFGETEIRRIETRLGPYMASGRLQQMPSPKGGGIIRREWWQSWDTEEAAKYGLEWDARRGGRKEFPEFDLIIGSLDTAYKEKEENDYSALTIWGIFSDRNKNRRAMLIYAWAKRLPLHGSEVERRSGEPTVTWKQRQQEEMGLVELVAQDCKKFKVNRLLIEDKARGIDVANELKRLYARENWGVHMVQVSQDKVARAHATVPVFADKAIFAPILEGLFMDWAEKVVVNAELFPKVDHDDLTDSCTMAINWLRINGLLVMRDEMSDLLEDAAAYQPQQESVAGHYGV